MPPISVTVVTGFLGAGKSTLLQHWLPQLPRDQTAVIVNELGQVGIDGELLSARATRLREITGGCVCCSSQSELARALLELAHSERPPTRVLVETSGAASPAGVIRALSAPRMRERMHLDGVIAVLDALRASEALAFDLTVEQLGFADVVVLSHCDQLASTEGADKLHEVSEVVRGFAPAAVIRTASHGQMSGSLLEVLAQREEALHVWSNASHRHDVIEAAALEVPGDLDEEAFTDWMEGTLSRVESRILRIKGILAMKGVQERVIVQGVSQAVEVSLGRPWGEAARVSRLVVLGLGLPADELEREFRRCAVQASPRRTSVDPGRT